MKLMYKAKEFYVENSMSLFKGVARPYWCAFFALLLEYLIYFSLILTPSFIDKQKQIISYASMLKYISIHMIPNEDQDFLVQLFLALNTLILLRILFYFLIYLIRPFKQMHGYFTAIVIMNYNIITVPSYIISFSSFSIQAIVNIVFTFIISQISILQSNNFYNYIIYDHLSKRGSIWDSLKSIIIILSIITLSQAAKEHYYIFTLIFSLVNSINLINFNFYHNQSISKLFLSINLCLFVISVITLLIMLVDLDYSIVLPLFCTPCLCLKMGSIIIDQLQFKTIKRIQLIFDNKSQDTSQIDSDRLIDFYTRYLVDNLNFNSKESQLFSQVHKQSTIFVTSINDHQVYQDEYTVSSSSTTNNKQTSSLGLGQFIINEDKNAAISLRNQLKELSLIFDENQKYARLINNFEKSQIKYSIRELFYLLEIEQNIPKLSIKLSEYTHQKKTNINITENSMIKYLKHEIQKREAKNLTNFIGLESAFNYEEDLEKAGNTLVEALKQKQNFLKTISKDNFDLKVILKSGPMFLKQRKEITDMLSKLAKQNDRNSEYLYLASIYQRNIQLDPEDSKFLKKLRQSGTIQVNQRMKKQLDLEEISRYTCLIIVSLTNTNFAAIKKVSRSCQKLIGYNPIDLIGKNCNMIQPNSIAFHHNMIMKEAIEVGKFRNSFKQNAPLIARTKEGFGVKIGLLFQLQGLSDENEMAGLIAQLKVKNNNFSKFALIDISQNRGYRIDVLSKPIYVEFFQKYFKSPKEVEGVQIHQMIPTLTNIGNYIKKENISKLNIQTLSFIPDSTTYIGDTKKRLSDSCNDIMKNVKKGYFNYEQNDIYLIEMSLKLYQRESAYEVITIKFRSVNRLIDETHIENAIEGILYPQWLEYGQVSEYQIQTYHNKLKEVVEYHKPVISFNGGIVPSQVSQQIIPSKLNNCSLLANQLQKSQVSIIQNDSIQYPIDDHFTIEQPSTYRNGQLLDIQQLKTLNSPYVVGENLYNDTKMDSFITHKDQEFSLEISHKNLNELKPHQLNKIPTKETNIESLLSPQTQTRNSQKIQQSISDLLVKINQNKLSAQKSDQNLKLQPKFQMIENEQQETQSIDFIDQASQNKQTAIDQRSVNLSNSSKESQTSSLRKVIVNKLMRQKQRKTIQMILVYVACSFFSILLTVIITHINLQQQIEHQQLSFSFSSWQDLYINNLLQSINCLQSYNLISLRAYSFSKSPYIEPLYNQLLPYIQMLFDMTLASMANIMRQDITRVFVKRELIDTKIPFVYLVPSFKNMTINATFFDSLIVISNFVPSLTLRKDSYGYVQEMELLSNAGGITLGLTTISEKQGSSEVQLNEDIVSSARLTLTLVSLITAIMAIIILPFYSVFQARQEKILRYFATIEPESIADMYDKISFSLQKLIQKKKNNFNLNLKENQDSIEIGNNQIIQKKKKHVSTTSLPKVNIALCFYALLLLATISIQPIVNYVLTDLQVNQQTKIQSFVRGLYTFKSAMYSVYYSANSYAAKVAFPYISLVPLNFTQIGLQESVKSGNKAGETFLTSLYEINNQNVFKDSEISSQVEQILSGDACEIFKNLQNTTLTYDQCSGVYGGAYKKGLLAAFSAYMLKIQMISEVSMRTQDKSTFLYIDNYFNFHSPLEAAAYFQIIESLITKLVELVDHQKQLFKETIDNTQTSLFIFEVSLLIILFPVVVVPFFNYIKNKIMTVVSMISIIQIRYILENSYMTSFIKTY